jgi:hypothetical protein
VSTLLMMSWCTTTPSSLPAPAAIIMRTRGEINAAVSTCAAERLCQALHQRLHQGLRRQRLTQLQIVLKLLSSQLYRIGQQSMLAFNMPWFNEGNGTLQPDTQQPPAAHLCVRA